MKKITLIAFWLGLIVSTTTQAQTDNPDILTVGDSITAGLFRSSGGVITCAALGGAVIAADRQRTCRGNGQEGVGGWQPRLKALTGVRVYNYGNSGETTAEMVARFASHLSARASGYVLIMGGTNDVISGVPTATIIANLTSMINAAKADGRIPIVGTIPPLLQGQFANRNNAVLQLNAAISNIADVRIADHYMALVGNWAANTSGDFIHLGVAGNNAVAQGWFDAINQAPDRGIVIAPILNLLSSNM